MLFSVSKMLIQPEFFHSQALAPWEKTGGDGPFFLNHAMGQCGTRCAHGETGERKKTSP